MCRPAITKRSATSLRTMVYITSRPLPLCRCFVQIPPGVVTLEDSLPEGSARPGVAMLRHVQDEHAPADATGRLADAKRSPADDSALLVVGEGRLQLGGVWNNQEIVWEE